MGRLRRFLPPQVADLIVASGTEKQLESHRREITALFCDLRGFTGFTEIADAEDVIALLREYHAAMIPMPKPISCPHRLWAPLWTLWSGCGALASESTRRRSARTRLTRRSFRA